MAESSSNADESCPGRAPPRRALRFSLRTLLVAVTLFCLWMGSVCNRANRQRRIVEAITANGGVVRYDTVTDEDGRDLPNAPAPAAPEWLRNLIGRDYFDTVLVVGIDYKKGVNDDSLALLADLPKL